MEATVAADLIHESAVPPPRDGIEADRRIPVPVLLSVVVATPHRNRKEVGVVGQGVGELPVVVRPSIHLGEGHGARLARGLRPGPRTAERRGRSCRA